jgi:hypothetical protein
MLRIALVLVLVLLLVPPASAQLQPTVIAGTGEEVTDDASRGDGGPATAARFHRVDGLDWSTSGSLLVADGDDGRIRRITPAGKIVTNRSEGLDDPVAVVSTGWQPSDPLQRHSFVAADVGDDTVEDWQLLTDHVTWRESVAMEEIDARDIEAAGNGYWVVDPSGETVWHLTFVGAPTHRWVQSPSLEGLDEPTGVGDLPGGGFLVATDGDCRIRRRTGGGTQIVAGTGFCAGRENGGNGDGGPATASHLGFPIDVEATPDGGFVLIERDRVRRVAPDGKISTVFVTGFSFSPDFPAPEPTALEVTPDGDTLIGLERRVLRFNTNYAPAATPAPTPPNNPLPPPPPPPPTPPPPGPGAIAPKPLTASLAKSAYKVAKGKRLRFVFTAAGAGRYTLEIRKGRRLAKRFKGAAKAGKNTVKKKVKLKPGRYKLTLRLKAGGTTATDTAKLRVTRARAGR